jgi:hypothetical protein
VNRTQRKVLFLLCFLKKAPSSNFWYNGFKKGRGKSMNFQEFFQKEIQPRKQIYDQRKQIAELDLNQLPNCLLESFNELRVNCLLGYDDAAIKLASSYVEVFMKFLLIAHGVVNEGKTYKDLLKHYDDKGNGTFLQEFKAIAKDEDDFKFCQQFNKHGLNIRNIELHNKFSAKIESMKLNDDIGLDGKPIEDETARKVIFDIIENTAVGTIVANRLGSSKKIVYLVENLYLLSVKYKDVLSLI